MKHKYQQQYKNVLIRQLKEDDLEFLRSWRNDSNNTKFLRPIPYITVEMQRKWFEAYLANTEEMTFAIEEIEDIHCIVGSMALYNFSGVEAEFGKILIGDSHAHGKSVGVNALEALKIIAKEKLHIQKLYLHVFMQNKTAIRVYQKVGFEIEDEHIADNGFREYTMCVQL